MKQKLHAVATALPKIKLKAESERLKAVGQFSQKQLTRRLPLLKLKAESERLKAGGQLSKKQLTRRLPQPASHKAYALGFAMTGEGEEVLFNAGNETSRAPKQSHATGSAGSVKRRAGSIASADEGSFYLDFFGYFFHLRKKVSSPAAASGENKRFNMKPFVLDKYERLKAVVKSSQKQLTRRLPPHHNSEPGASLIAMMGCRKGLHRLKVKALTMIIIITVVVIGGKRSNAQIPKTYSLSIGSTVPDISLGNMVGYTDATNLKTSDYANQLLILDFWATWCSPCVSAFPKMDSLRKQFGKQVFILPVSSQSEQTITNFLANMQQVKGVKAFSVVGDTLLKKLFPNNELPHYVWIKNGKLIAVTDGSQVNEPLIKAVLAGKTSGLKSKENVSKLYDTKYPLFSEQNGIPAASILNYHLFSRYVPGYRSMLESAITPDGGRKIVAINFSAYKLYQLAYSKVKPALLGSENRMVVAVSDTLSLKGPGFKRVGKEAYHQWQKEHAYCYEIGSASASTAIWTQMQEDLKRAFPQWDARLEEKISKCLVMRCKDPQLLKTQGGITHLQESKYAFSMHNKDWNIFINRLTSYYLQLSPFPLVDETGIKGAIDLSITCNLSDVNALRKALASYGISLEEEDRTLEMIVIRDSHPSN